MRRDAQQIPSHVLVSVCVCVKTETLSLEDQREPWERTERRTFFGQRPIRYGALPSASSPPQARLTFNFSILVTNA